ncbi:EAL domain-containing response regulator [Vibrio jasicida]|uniref:EAL domain-containing response regulator n=1 Tax=Vibrio jasicida TaxID=766224 RepID=UPI004068324D
MEILILEESKQLAKVISDILAQNFGLTSDIAEDVPHALTLVSQNKYEMFFFNAVAFKSEGIFYFSRLERSHVPLGIMITSRGCEDINSLICDMCLIAGCDVAVYVKKAIDLAEVGDFITKVISEKGKINANKKRMLNYLSKEEVEDGLKKGYFLNYYQPQYSTETNNLLSVEALIRFNSPELGVLSPASFMRSFDVNRLFWLVLERALIDISLLNRNIGLSVNINQRTLKEPISDRILSLCDFYNFSPSRLTLELTEDEAFDPDVISLANLTVLRLAGIGLAIDDFGTGHSSLSQLVTLPYTELKIDQKFVCNLTRNFKSRQVLATSLFLAKSLKMKSIAEGVENKETLSYISSVGVDLYQGYFGSKPIPIEELIKLQ